MEEDFAAQPLPAQAAIEALDVPSRRALEEFEPLKVLRHELANEPTSDAEPKENTVIAATETNPPEAVPEALPASPAPPAPGHPVPDISQPTSGANGHAQN